MKHLNKIGLFILVFFLGITVHAQEMGEIAFCSEVSVLKAFRILAFFITVVKIVVPVIIIITGIISLSRAVLSEDDGAIKKSINTLIAKIVVGVFIAFIPTIIYTLMDFVSDYDKTSSNFTDCGKCLNSYKTCNELIGD